MSARGERVLFATFWGLALLLGAAFVTWLVASIAGWVSG